MVANWIEVYDVASGLGITDANTRMAEYMYDGWAIETVDIHNGVMVISYSRKVEWTNWGAKYWTARKAGPF